MFIRNRTGPVSAMIFNRHRKARGVLEICPRERFVMVSVYFPRMRQAYGEAKWTSNALFCEI